MEVYNIVEKELLRPQELKEHVKRRTENYAPDIAIHDYIGHMASSQAYCWNIVLPMKRHDNFAPLFNALSAALQEENVEYTFDFGVETAVVIEMNVSRDLGEAKQGTSIDLSFEMIQAWSAP